MKNKILSAIYLVFLFSLCLIAKPQPIFATVISPPQSVSVVVRCLLILSLIFIPFLTALIISLIILFLKRKNENSKSHLLKIIKKISVVLVTIVLLALFVVFFLTSILKIFIGKDNPFFQPKTVSCFGPLCPGYKESQITPTPISSFFPLQNSEKTAISFGTSRLEVPKNFLIGRLYVSSNDGQKYLIESAGNSPGPCPWEDDGTGCAGYDEKLDVYSTKKIWKNKYGIVAINPQGDTQSYSYVIYKYDPTQEEKYTYLSGPEVQMWKDIITGNLR